MCQRRQRNANSVPPDPLSGPTRVYVYINFVRDIDLPDHRISDISDISDISEIQNRHILPAAISR